MPDANGKEYEHEIDDRVSDAAIATDRADYAAGRLRDAKGSENDRPSAAEVVPSEPYVPWEHHARADSNLAADASTAAESDPDRFETVAAAAHELASRSWERAARQEPTAAGRQAARQVSRSHTRSASALRTGDLMPPDARRRFTVKDGPVDEERDENGKWTYTGAVTHARSMSDVADRLAGNHAKSWDLHNAAQDAWKEVAVMAHDRRDTPVAEEASHQITHHAHAMDYHLAQDLFHHVTTDYLEPSTMKTDEDRFDEAYRRAADPSDPIHTRPLHGAGG